VIPKTPYYTYEVFGMQGFMTHGDTVLNPGYPNKSIDVEKVRRQINEINGKLAPDKRYTLFGVGHVHVYSMVRLPNRVTFMSNGCLIPTDSFAQSIGIMDTACCQAIWESVDGHIVGDRREANVDEGVDKDKDLDLIIQPFNGL
jgi:hypothetical protein